MSLNAQELKQTSMELKQNFELSELTRDDVCTDLNISERELDSVLELVGENPTTVWRVRDYLVEKIEEQGKEPIPFSVLKVNIYYPYD